MSKLNRETHFFKTARTVEPINQTVVLLWFVYPVVGSAITVNMQPQDSRERSNCHIRFCLYHTVLERFLSGRCRVRLRAKTLREKTNTQES